MELYEHSSYEQLSYNQVVIKLESSQNQSGNKEEYMRMRRVKIEESEAVSTYDTITLMYFFALVGTNFVQNLSGGIQGKIQVNNPGRYPEIKSGSKGGNPSSTSFEFPKFSTTRWSALEAFWW